MSFARQVSRMLDEEHRASLELVGRVEHAFVRAPRPGAPRDPEIARVASAFARHLEQEIGRHFEFEERELFPRLATAGEGDIAALLEEEHDAIRAVAADVLPLALAAAAGTIADADFQALKRGSLELVERLVGHIQKETMGLLPMLDLLLDEDTDRDLALAYAAG
jgi:hemerythrin-like domain-containing protein